MRSSVICTNRRGLEMPFVWDGDDPDTPFGALNSRGLACFVIDALLREGIITQERVDLAIEIATEEIAVRHFSGELRYT